MNRLNQRILQTCDARMEQIKKKLEFEENARKIANLQGELLGIKHFLEQYDAHMRVTEKVFTEEMINNTGFPKVANELSDEDLKTFDQLIDEKVRDPEWQELEYAVRGEIERQKDYLFHRAEKSRDFDFVHGKRDGLLLYDDVVNELLNELKDIKENYPLFNSDDDAEDRTPGSLRLLADSKDVEEEADEEDQVEDDFYEDDEEASTL